MKKDNPDAQDQIHPFRPKLVAHERRHAHQDDCQSNEVVAPGNKDSAGRNVDEVRNHPKRKEHPDPVDDDPLLLPTLPLHYCLRVLSSPAVKPL
ncbi:MAG: hypothetical protein IH582_08690 [Afipia sp.]|nr:hypothetical protein [Afipia sp.]